MSDPTSPSHAPVEKSRLVTRARRVEGQAAGVVRMVAAERPCGEILQQIVALTSAAEELGVLLIQDHVLRRCRGTEVDAERLSEELAALLRRVVRR